MSTQFRDATKTPDPDTVASFAETALKLGGKSDDECVELCDR